MKRLLFTILAVIMTATSCVEDFRNEISEIHEQIDELRTLINKANSNLEALQTIVSAIQNNDFVTGITPIVENGSKVGYIISEK